MTPIYLDCNATTPVDPRVRDEMLRWLDTEFGNAGSRTHRYGERAKQAVELARAQVAAVVAARRHEVIFTSGATESNNLAILGLARHGERTGKRHVVSTQIEHKAVLEPLEELVRRGFEVSLVPPTRGGSVEAQAVHEAVRADTLLVSVMHVNNETGVVQPVAEIADRLADRAAYFHVDAAQGFGKEIEPLRHPRIDLISISGHKIYGPKGVGALVARRSRPPGGTWEAPRTSECDGRRPGQGAAGPRRRRTGASLRSGPGQPLSRPAVRALSPLPPLAPLLFGGGQEFGLRPGTLPVHLIAGLGKAAELALEEHRDRADRCRTFRARLLEGLAPLSPVLHADPQRTLPHVINLSFPGLDSDDVMEALAGLVAISNGSACTSVCDTASHVLAAMGLPRHQIDGALRFSWCHVTPDVDWPAVCACVEELKRGDRLAGNAEMNTHRPGC